MGIEIPVSANKNNGVAFGGTGGFSPRVMELIARVVNIKPSITESQKNKEEYLASLRGDRQRPEKPKTKKKK